MLIDYFDWANMIQLLVFHLPDIVLKHFFRGTIERVDSIGIMFPLRPVSTSRSAAATLEAIVKNQDPIVIVFGFWCVTYSSPHLVVIECVGPLRRGSQCLLNVTYKVVVVLFLLSVARKNGMYYLVFL
jgi:hypothetical protein